MPVETQSCGVVAEIAAACPKDCLGEVLHRLASMHMRACAQDGSDVHTRGVALQHAVGDEHQPVSYLQLQRLHPVAASGLQAERAVGLQMNPLDLP